jgi:hypothetical protein
MKTKDSVVVKSKKLKDLKNRLIVVKVGDAERPASPEDITSIKKQFKKVLKGIKCRVLVTHHAVRVSTI